MDIRSAEIVIIGGGIIGCSIAYHLARLGRTDVVVLEKSGLTHGATWHAAGLVGQLRSSRNTTRMLRFSVELYDRLEAETGQPIDWRKHGSLRLACSAEREMENARSYTMARAFGLEIEWLTPEAAQRLFPLMSLTDVRSALYIPSDGYIDPASVCLALAKGARDRGVRIVQGERVTGFRAANRRIHTVVTDAGEWQCEIVVNATGMWGRELGALAGTRIPALAVEHQYLITDPIPDLPAGMPTLRDPDHRVYYKPDRGLVVGGYEDGTKPFGTRGIPKSFGQELLVDDFERFEPLATLAAKRTPILDTVGIRRLLNGAIPYSADGDFVMGRTPEVDNMFVAAGLLYGIAAGGGVGRMMAEWICGGEPSLNLWPLDVRRFGFHHATRWFLERRPVELYGRHYALHRPGDEHESARGIRKSPLWWILRDRGAVYGSRNGWERPNWFAPPGTEAVDVPAFDRARTNWFPHVAAEHRAVREGVALIDQTSFSKLEVSGPGALALLNRLAVSEIDRPVGTAIYTQLCNERGGIEADLTICRLASDRFYLVTGSAFGGHDRHWIETHLPADGSVRIEDVTSARAVINLCGPFSRRVLEQVAEEDVSDAAFPFATLREITVGAAPVRAIRIGYTGERGYELHVPTEYGAHLYEVLAEAGAAFGIRDVGYRAIDSLRIEKGYVYWSAEVTPDDTPFEAGLGFRVKLAKPDFIGRDALLRQKQDGVRRRLATFVLERPLPVMGGETILLDDRPVGVTTSGNFGHTLGRSIAMGYLPAELFDRRDFTIECFRDTSPAERCDGPLYDPENLRLKG